MLKLVAFVGIGAAIGVVAADKIDKAVGDKIKNPSYRSLAKTGMTAGIGAGAFALLNAAF